MIDERHQEAAALYALDLLEGAERTAFESVLASDRELRRLVDQLRETSANIALLATPAEPSAFLRERILADVADRSPTSADHTIPFRLPFWAGWAAASVFIIATGYFAGVNFNTRSQFGALRESERLSRIEAQNLSNQLEAERLISRRQIDSLRLAQADIAELKQQNALADLKIDSLASLVANTPDARAIAVWNPHTQEGILTVTKLPALADGKDYQLWVVDPQYPIPVDGGVFQVDPVTGEARVTFKPNKPVATVAKFAVSLERKGGVPKAEGTMMLLSY
jgi:anti-sigma-K factor RskA